MKEIVIRVLYNPEGTNELLLQSYIADMLWNSPDVIKYTMATEDLELGD